MSETTLRDMVESAIEEHTADVEQSDRARDEMGRFAAKEQEQQEFIPEQSAIEQEAQPQEEVKPVKPRPSSWKKDYEEHWSKFDPSVQDYILQREADYAKGVSTYKAQWDQAAPIYEAMQGFMPLLQQHNIQPQQWIQNLGNAHKTLALGSPEEKLQMFARLANDYGVNLGALTGGNVDPQFSMLTQELNNLRNEWTGYKSSIEQQEHAKLVSELEAFKQNAPHYEALRETMAQLLEANVASSLQDAYDKAMRLNDEVWQQHQSEQAKAAEAEKIKQAQAAKAKAVSTKSATPTGLETAGSGKKGLRDVIAEQLLSADARV